MSRFLGDHIKSVLLDHDDTMVGTIEAKWAAHKFNAKIHYGKDLADDEIRMHWGIPLRQLVGILYGDEDLDRALAHEEETHQTFPKILFEHTNAVLNKLKGSGFLLGVITAASRASLDNDFRTLGISHDAFDYTQTQDDTPYHKPDKRVFDPALAWLVQHDITPQETLYIGDGLLDMEASIGAGMNFLGVETGLITADGFKAASATSIPHLGHLLEE